MLARSSYPRAARSGRSRRSSTQALLRVVTQPPRLGHRDAGGRRHAQEREASVRELASSSPKLGYAPAGLIALVYSTMERTDADACIGLLVRKRNRSRDQSSSGDCGQTAPQTTSGSALAAPMAKLRGAVHGYVVDVTCG